MSFAVSGVRRAHSDPVGSVRFVRALWFRFRVSGVLLSGSIRVCQGSSFRKLLLSFFKVLTE